jgi:hypothetical protein
MLNVDPTQPTAANVAWSIGVLVICMVVFYQMIKNVEKTKRNKHNNFNEHDIY